MVENIKRGRERRQKQVQDIIYRLENNDAFIVSDYRGLSVNAITEIRNTIREDNAEMHIHRNRLTKIALEKKKYSDKVKEIFSGPNAIVYVKGDATVVIKKLFSFIKKEYPLTVKAAYMDERLYEEKDVLQISKLPGRNELLAKLAGTCNAPIQSFVGSCNDVVTRFARTLQAVADSK